MRKDKIKRFQVSVVWFKGSTFKGSEVIDKRNKRSGVMSKGRGSKQQQETRTLDPLNPEPLNL